MIGLFKWMERLVPADCGDLGAGSVVMRTGAGRSVPAGCVGLAADASGQVRRFAAGQKMDVGPQEMAWCFHPGPYRFDLAPFVLAPEMGLHIQVVVDEPDPRLRQQRFDLFVMAEVGECLGADALRELLETAVCAALEQGALELAPCTSLDEWHAFRANLNQLVYTRFGLTVEDCFPVDLADRVDFAAMLAARAAPSQFDATALPLTGNGQGGDGGLRAPQDGGQRSASIATGAIDRARAAAQDEGANRMDGADGSSSGSVTARPDQVAADCATLGGSAFADSSAPRESGGAAPPWRNAAASAMASVRARFGRADVDAAQVDALALRRLFLELPNVMCGLRLAALPDCPDVFRTQQALLARLDLVVLSVNTMPALDLEAPGVRLAAPEQQRRAAASTRAMAGLDEAWSLLARIELAGRLDETTADAADRIIANLEHCVADRRAVHALREDDE